MFHQVCLSCWKFWTSFNQYLYFSEIYISFPFFTAKIELDRCYFSFEHRHTIQLDLKNERSLNILFDNFQKSLDPSICNAGVILIMKLSSVKHDYTSHYIKALFVQFETIHMSPGEVVNTDSNIKFFLMFNR